MIVIFGLKKYLKRLHLEKSERNIWGELVFSIELGGIALNLK